MEINGLITASDGDSVRVVGFTGNDLICQGCGETAPALYETDDEVMLCERCYKLCAEDLEDKG